MDKKIMAQKIKNIKVKERLSEKLTKFFNTTKGESLIRRIGYGNIDDIMSQFKAPSVVHIRSYTQKMNIVLSAVEKAGKTPLLRYNTNKSISDIVNNENAQDAARHRFVENYQKNKVPNKLLPFEQKQLNMKSEWVIKRNPDGTPIIKQEDGKLLYDKASNIPIYVYRKKPTKLGLAAKLHGYEIHKMKKYDKIMSMMKEREMTSDLFPEQIDAKYKMLRESHLEQLRKDLSDLYCPGTVTVVEQNKKDESIKKTKLNVRLRLGMIRKRALQRNATINALNKIAVSTNVDPEMRLTCIHIDYPKLKRYGKVLLPETFMKAA